MKICRSKRFTDEYQDELSFTGYKDKLDITIVVPRHEEPDPEGGEFTVLGSVATFHMKRPKVKALVRHLTEWLEETK